MEFIVSILQTIVTEVTTLLVQLGINESFYFHLVIFVIAFSLLKVIIFDPYVAALEERDRRTVGGEELASELVRNSEELQAKFEKRAKEINGQVSQIYNSHETSARKAQDEILGTARTEAATELENSRSRIAKEIESTREQLKTHVKDIAQDVTSQLIRG